MNKQIIPTLCDINHPVIFEIGCADGLDTLDILNAFGNIKDLEIYCFEPYEVNIKKFKRNINDSRVKLFEVAVGNKNGEVEFNISLGNNFYSSSLKEPGESLFRTWNNLFPNRDSFGKTIVRTITLDCFVNDKNIDMIDFVWLDCQGAEDLVIEGGKETFQKKVKYLYTEYSNQEIYVGEPSLQDILNMLPNYTIIENFPNLSGDLLGGDVLLKNVSI